MGRKARQTDQPQGRGRWEQRAHDVQEDIARWLDVGQDLILILVACVLLLAGLVVVLDGIQDLIQAAAAQQLGEVVFDVVENALLALILAELVNTLLVALSGDPITPEPFLIIAIVAILREVLLATVLLPKGREAGGLISAATVELLVLGVLILILGVVLVLVRMVRARA